jgi:hypothetical protein
MNQSSADWDPDWDCKRAATGSRGSVDVWALIDGKPTRAYSAGAPEQDPAPEPPSSSSDDPCKVAPQATLVDGQLWDFLGSFKRSSKAEAGHLDGDVWSFMSRDMKTTKPPPGYDALLSEGMKLSDQDCAAYHRMVWWSDSLTAEGSRIFVLAPLNLDDLTDAFCCCLPRLNMRRLVAYVVRIMHEHVVKQDKAFAVVWLQLNELRLSPLKMWQMKHRFHAMYAKNLEVMHIVHPSWTIRCLELASFCDFWPFAENCMEKVHVHERIEFLARHIDLQALALHAEFFDHDEFLEMQNELFKTYVETGRLEPGCGQFSY